MLTPLSILSLEQGKLHPKPQDEAAYFARFAAKPAAVKPENAGWRALVLKWWGRTGRPHGAI